MPDDLDLMLRKLLYRSEAPDGGDLFEEGDQMAESLSDFSKIEEGKKEYEFEEIDMAKLVTQHIEDFQREEIAKGMKIEIRIPEEIPRLRVDKEALTQALNNLLDNAVKFSSDRKEIEVVLKKDDMNVILEVKDKGIGILADELDKIFDKFYQGSNQVRTAAKGTGLGLMIAKKIIDEAGGEIDLDSEEGKGSKFVIKLPEKSNISDSEAN